MSQKCQLFVRQNGLNGAAVMSTAQTPKQILIVDRDVAAIEALRQKLSDVGFIVRAMTDGTAGVTALAERPPDLVIMDWNMPGFAALDLIKGVRLAPAQRPIRLIILSALNAEQDVVTGLDLGADDYIVKPYSLKEAVARVEAVLRSRGRDIQQQELAAGNLVLDPTTNKVTAVGRLINLRGVEYRLLEFLMSHPGRTFNRAQLSVQIWGFDADIDERTVDVNVQRLRKLLNDSGCKSYLQTVRGFGYRFSAPLHERGLG
jgi:two-component system phosphate regulon response regulator PhoB